MTPNLPLSLAQLIPTMFHVKAEAALMAHVEQLLASNVQRANEDFVRSFQAHVASFGSVQPPAQDAPAQSAPATPHKQHIIVADERGLHHKRYVATFRAKFPNGERELRDTIECLPGGTKFSRVQMDAIKRHFSMGARSLLLSPMLRELGCRDDGRGQWTTPVLRLVTAAAP